jgi:hypothetical protein
MAYPMFATLAQYITGKVVTAILVVAGGAALIWFWQHPEQLAAIWKTLKYVVTWIGFVLVLPWTLFFITPWVAKKESNLAAGVMLAGFVIADALVAFYLIGGVGGMGSLTWMVLILGFLCAGVYNLMVCNYQAGRLEQY